MITKFRIEAVGETKHDLAEELQNAAAAVIQLTPEETSEDARIWVTTQDVITGAPGKYQGRVVFSYREPVL